MKKTYLAPTSEEVMINFQTALLAGSENQGGGINDDNSGNTDDTPSEDPTDDFGW